MKMLLCNDVRLGAVCAENLDVGLSHKWQSLRIEKLASLIDKAAQENAAYIGLFGHIFGRERVSESVIDSMFQTVREDKHIQVLLFLDHAEYNRINYRNDIPDNLHTMCAETSDRYVDDAVAVRMEKGIVEMQLSDNKPVTFQKNISGTYCISGVDNQEKMLLSFEPLGFEDSEGAKFGYSLIEWSEDEITGYAEKASRIFAYKTLDVTLTPADDQKEISAKIAKIIAGSDRDTFLRVNIKGKSAFAVMLSADALKTQLQNKVFYAEVYVNTVMDIDTEAFENDISLRSEFVRLALQDDTLSETERNRLIWCGWNALTGRGVSE